MSENLINSCRRTRRIFTEMTVVVPGESGTGYQERKKDTRNVQHRKRMRASKIQVSLCPGGVSYNF